jgi:Holliday junction resolvase-like predicted endonuclease
MPLSAREQGDLGELSAMEWVAWQGAHVFVPVGHSPDIDLIADFGDRVLRVEVKTSTFHRSDRWSVLISTRGGNQSWSGRVKYFEASRCDYLFVAVADGRRWFIPTGDLDCRSGLTLGGPKYSEFEIERGRPFPDGSLESLSPRGSAGVGEPGRPVKSVATPEWVRIPPPPLTTSNVPPRNHRTRISAKHQVTIPSGAFQSAGYAVGDRLHATADGPGRVILERVAETSNRLATDDRAEPTLLD